MGSEHSSGIQQRNAKESARSNVRRQHTVPNVDSGSNEISLETGENGRSGSISPGPSVCSDVDLPYISYTVNRPIGDSPKLTNKQLVKSKSTGSRRVQPLKTLSKSKNVHNIVVVREADCSSTNTHKDPDVVRLQGIPMFLPIMRATLSLPAARDPEVLERLDPAAFKNLCLRYQHHLTTAANLVATEQNYLTQKTREIDNDITKIISTATDKQRKFAKYAEKFIKIQELSHQLNRCHMLLNQTLESMETLNNQLSIEERLEPFVWTTG